MNSPLDDPRWAWVRAAARVPVSPPPDLVERVLGALRDAEPGELDGPAHALLTGGVQGLRGQGPPEGQ